MPVLMIKKSTLITILVVVILVIAGVLLLVRIARDDERQPDAAVPEPRVETMTEVESYELHMLPLFSKELPVYCVSRDDKKIALTIDAAWSTDKTEFILSELDRQDVRATFFLCGVWVDAYPDYVKMIAEAGHEIGNHSLSHPHMNTLSREEVQREISSLDDTIEQLTGSRCTLFRAPFGEYNNTVITAVREIGYEVVQWSLDTVDWKESRSTQQILDGVLPKLKSGDIILCHNNGFKIEEYLPILIKTAKEQGFTFVTVGELLLSGNTAIDVNGMQKPA